MWISPERNTSKERTHVTIADSSETARSKVEQIVITVGLGAKVHATLATDAATKVIHQCPGNWLAQAASGPADTVHPISANDILCRGNHDNISNTSSVADTTVRLS